VNLIVHTSANPRSWAITKAHLEIRQRLLVSIEGRRRLLASFALPIGAAARTGRGAI